ncbi:hypothetical protein [Streptomyces sp. NL15-2K]|uniref:hypothetical protein n=1 Tax=Streptomyces sp. NL15-2K TaxID=376149 RepID=UPI000F5768A1|nr:MULTISPECIES: hypothetical protein [Actinomycetes]WKX13498.1 hypothetical protein Q4V64_40615 [Kutzneria buriramensis]GCB45119.1 ACT domain containing transcriptional regulators [Streptomyces sp. NL15-2K]
MAGREFGHHLGLPQALTGLPLSPLVPAYAELTAAQQAAGLRHLGEALTGSGGGLRVLDGLYVPSGPRGARRVDGPLLDDLARAATATAGLAGLLAGLHRRDPSALRRVVLYQLIGLLQDRPEAERPRVAAELGIHADEVAGMVAAARLRPVLTPRQRGAAESVADAWERDRLHRVRGLLERLPTGGGDAGLEAVRTALTARLAAVDAALLAARGAEERGDTEAASAQFLRALREAADDRRALGGLVRLHRPRGGRRAPLHAELAADRVELAWDPQGVADRDWRLLCLYRTEQGAHRVREVSARGGTARDEEAALGTTVRYAALPLRDGRVDGPPLVSHRVLVAPEVTEVSLTDGPERVDCSWRRPPGAVEVAVEHTGPSSGAAEPLGSRPEGFTATGLPTGVHAFRIACGYRVPGGDLVYSPGIRVTRTVHPWPDPVRTLTARPEDTGVCFDWTGGRDAEVRLVEWPGEAPRPGTELRTSDLPPRLPWPDKPDNVRALCPPPGAYARVAAVAVLGERALAGPVVDVEALAHVRGLAARRLPDGQARVSLDWPDGAGHLTVSWADLTEEPAEPGGATRAGTQRVTEPAGRTRTVTAHAYRRGGLRLPVGPGGVRVRVVAAPRDPGAVVVPAPVAEVVLPPDAAIGYQLVRAPRRLLGRGRAARLRVTLSAPGGAPPDAPEFVCVARSGTLRPRNAADGTTVLRVPGTDLTRHGTVELELPPAPCPAPYTLRGFLLGERAASVRLEEPSPATLVVR